jgi:uncharacterized lipoprotein YddW (UPF0748 family)
VWVATVANIDWPSKRTLTTEQQQQELHRIVDMAANANINAILLQVRPTCDTIYPSELEPWSEFLTGKSGKAPDPAYHPLAMWISECHARGIELHAWFNPFRSRHFEAKGPDAPNHVNNAHKDWVRDYDRYKWLDPGVDEARAFSLNVIRDVVKRYDVDGVHIDDYFYPYPNDKDRFPDDSTFSAYKAAGGDLAWDDWRRDRINIFVKAMYEAVKADKPHVKVGISPFGIWRPGFPATVRKGFDSFAKLNADSRKWLNEGWMDYCSPQIYWQVTSPDQPFADLLHWWSSENTKHRVLAPGLYTSKLDSTGKWAVDDILEQIKVTRANPDAAGEVHFSAKALLQNYKGIATALASGPYAAPALMPIFESCPGPAPAPLKLVRCESGAKVDVLWAPPADARTVIIGWRLGTQWQWQIAPAAAGGAGMTSDKLDAVAIAELDRHFHLR